MKAAFNLLTSVSLRFRALTIVLVIVSLVLGVVAMGDMNQELLPPIELPQTFVLAQASGMTSDQVLTILTQRIEEQLDSIEDIINIESQTTGSFGTFITAFNDFGLNQSKLQDEIRGAINTVWLPDRRISVDDGSTMVADLSADVFIYIASMDENFLFELQPEIWEELSAETIEPVLAYLANQTEDTTTRTNALERLVNAEVVPQLTAIESVARVEVAGGQTLPGQEDTFGGEVTEAESTSLLLRLSPEVWDIVSEKVDGLNALNDTAVEALQDREFNLPTTPPELPESWQAFDYFVTAEDLIEIDTPTNSTANQLNDFYETGDLIGQLGTTADLSVETINNMVAIEPTMLQYFEASHLVAMAPEVRAAVLANEDFVNGLDGFTRDALAAAALAGALSGQEAEREPVELPDQWRIQHPSIITFSFADIPLAYFSISATGEVPTVNEEASAPISVARGLESIFRQEEPPALPEVFAQLGENLEVEMDTADDMLEVPMPPTAVALLGESLDAAGLLNLFGAPPDAVAPFLNMFVPVSPEELLGALSPDVITYLAGQQPTFVESLAPSTIAMLNDDVQALEILADAASAEPEETDEEPVAEEPVEIPEGPAINSEWGFVGEMLSAELDTADDLLALPGGFAGFINGAIESSPDAADQIGPLLGNLPVDAAEFVLEYDPTAFDGLSEAALIGLSDAVLALLPQETQERAPRALGDAWDELAGQPQFADMPLQTASDVLALGDGSASDVLNLIHEDIPAEFETYEIRLFNSLTPGVIQVWLREEEDFYTNLDPEVLVLFAPEALANVPEDVLDTLPEETAQTIQAIASGEQDSAAAALQALYATDVAPADPDAPALNPQWSFLEPSYQIELDSADDFFRFPEGYIYQDASALINSIFDSAQGASFAPALLGNMPIDAIEYMLERDSAAFDDLIGRALQLLPEEGLALLSEELQQRAAEGGEAFIPDNAVTRTNGQPSLQVAVYKNSDANTVSTFGAVEKLLEQIDEEDAAIDVSVIFEQSTFVEESINGVAREGTLGAIFAIIIILIFLSTGTWNLKGRRRVGVITMIAFLLGIIFVVMLGYKDAGNDLGQAWYNADVVVRVLMIFGFISGAVFLFWPGKLPDPAWRATLVIGISIPLSILMAFIGMRWVSPALYGIIQPLSEDSDFFAFLLRLFPEELTLNLMTLSGLTVAVGRVVDDSIVVLENIFRNLEADEVTAENKKHAVLDGTRDVSAAIFIATIIAMVVFLPLGLTGGIIGAFFLPFGLAVTYALAGSFIVAVTIVPVLAYLFINPDQIPDEGDMWIAAYYRPVLKWALRGLGTKWTVLIIAFLSMIFGLYLFGQRPFAFLPDFGEPQIAVTIELPGDTKITETNALVAELESYIEETVNDEDLTAIQTSIGNSGAGFEALVGGSTVSENVASITVGLSVGIEPSVYDELVVKIRERAEEIFDGPDNVTVSGASIAEGGFGGLQLIVSGPPEVIAELDPLVIEAISSVEGITNVTSNLTDSAASSDGPPTYIRVNLESALSYTGELETENTIGVTQEALSAIKDVPEIAERDDIKVSQGFSSEIQTEGFNSLPIAMGIAIVIVIIILAFTMQSAVYWLSIILSIMVAPVGAAIALTLTDRVLGISSLIGLLMLIGLVITNAVVLIDRVLSNRHERGMNLHDALIEAGGRRLRPILMTSLATMIALFPLAIGLSEGAIIAAELGTVVIGGVFSSTLLTLIVVPVAFSLLHPIHRILSIRRGKEENE